MDEEPIFSFFSLYQVRVSVCEGEKRDYGIKMGINRNQEGIRELFVDEGMSSLSRGLKGIESYFSSTYYYSRGD